MVNIINKFENKTKTRVNLIDIENLGKSQLKKLVIKDGIFEETDFLKSDNHVSFPTEILCSSTKNNFVTVYLNLKSKRTMIEKLKDNIIKSFYETCLILNDVIDYTAKNNNFTNEERLRKTFCHALSSQTDSISLMKFYEVSHIQEILKEINFNELFIELKEMNHSNDSDIFEGKDDYIWKTYFYEFENNFGKRYDRWMKIISGCYVEDEEGHEYRNESKDFVNKFSNKDFSSLCKILYGIDSSCDLIVERVYIKVPSSKTQYLGIVFIDYPYNENIERIIENRISEDRKELFIILSKCSDNVEYFSELKKNINSSTLNKRIFYVLNEFNAYKQQLFRSEAIYFKFKEDIIDTLKYNVSKKIGIKENKVIVTEQFRDINKRTLECLNTKNDFLQLLRLIRKESERIGKPIKIKCSNKERLINISLNQERMIVQALMGMLYERYNGYLVEQWNRIIENENSKEHKKYTYGEINTIIRNRKDNYKDYKYSVTSDINKSIDFSLKNGDCNDSKKILKILVNYGYQTVGFDSNENKILVNVNGEISQEDKDKLIESIKGRLEESAINYFQNAFLMDVSRKKFNMNNLNKALEIERSMTIHDFYSAFKEMFKKISDNIIRYEVCFK